MTRKIRNPFTMNLQFFADGEGQQPVDTRVESTQESTHEDDRPSYEELLEQLAKAQANEAKANAEKERFKNSVDELTKKNKNLTEQVRNRMTADEQIEAAKKEAGEAAKKEVESMQEEINQLKAERRMANYSKRYMGVGMDEKAAEGMAGLTGELADPEKFFSELGKFIKSATTTAGENAMQEFLKRRSDIQAGTGDTGASLAVEKAKELATRKRVLNLEALKHFM